MSPLGLVVGLLVPMSLVAAISAGLSYLMIAAGARLYGRIGMKMAASIMVLLAAAPIVMSLLEAFTWVSTGGPVYADQLASVLLIATIGLGSLAGLGAIVFFQWYDLASRAPHRSQSADRL